MVKSQPALGVRDYAIILLTIATALIHLTLIFGDPVFTLNGLGYLGLLAALYLPIPQLIGYRAQIRWVLMGYTALTVLLWIFLGAHAFIAYIDKIIEVILIVLLWLKSQKTV